MSKVAVKICCIQSVREAELAIHAGASAIGLVGPMPSGPGIISVDKAGEITEAVANRIETFLLTSCRSAKEIFAQYQIVKSNTIQLVDSIDQQELRQVRDLCPGVKLVQVIHVLSESDVDLAYQTAQQVDAILLDSGNPHRATKELGGTGRTHNWDISKAIVESVSIPVYLAGGLKSVNVREAIEYVQPYGVDLCSGVRTNGLLDQDKLIEFFTFVNAAHG